MPAPLDNRTRAKMFHSWVACQSIAGVSVRCGVSRPTVRLYKDQDDWLGQYESMNAELLAHGIGGVDKLREEYVRLAHAMIKDFGDRFERGEVQVSDPWQFIHLGKFVMGARGDPVVMEKSEVVLTNGTKLDEADTAELEEERELRAEQRERAHARLAKCRERKIGVLK